jgi:hypothetical protein
MIVKSILLLASGLSLIGTQYSVAGTCSLIEQATQPNGSIVTQTVQFVADSSGMVYQAQTLDFSATVTVYTNAVTTTIKGPNSTLIFPTNLGSSPGPASISLVTGAALSDTDIGKLAVIVCSN